MLTSTRVVIAVGVMTLTACSGTTSTSSTGSTSSPTGTEQASAATTDAKALAYLRETYPDKAWAGEVTAVRVVAGALWAETTYVNDADGRRVGKEVCVALSGYEIMQAGGFTGVSVRAADGQGIANRRTLSDDC